MCVCVCLCTRSVQYIKINMVLNYSLIYAMKLSLIDREVIKQRWHLQNLNLHIIQV